MHMITIQIPTEQRRWVVEPTVFTFNAAAKWPKVQRACFWLLDKIGCRYRREVSFYTRVAISSEDFTNAIMSQLQYIACNTDIKPTAVLMGPEDFARLANDRTARTYLQVHEFNATAEYWSRSGAREHLDPWEVKTKRHVFGLRVYILPWMTGVLVVPPKSLLEERFS